MTLVTDPTPIFWTRTRTRAARALAAGSLALLLGGCAEGSGGATGATQVRADQAESFVLAGPGAVARVTRSASPDGSEALHGETDVTLGGGARRRVIEDVTLDADGRLLAAAISVSAGDAPERGPLVQMQLDAARGVVRVITAEGVDEQRAAADAPWIYAPPRGTGGEGATDEAPAPTLATPVAAWVALRAAAASPWVRLVDLDRRQGWLVPRDQVAVPNEAGVTAVVGNEGADASSGFIDQIRLNEPRITLVRAPRAERLVL